MTDDLQIISMDAVEDVRSNAAMYLPASAEVLGTKLALSESFAPLRVVAFRCPDEPSW